MKLDTQKRIASTILGVSPHRVRFERARLQDIKEAITKTDMRGLIKEGAVTKIPQKGVSRANARKRQVQRSKGLQKGPAKKEGTRKARIGHKQEWMKKIRTQRKLLVTLKENGLVEAKTYRDLYKKAKGGYFRSRRHIKLYLEERKLIKQ